MSDFDQELKAIQERNARVEADKAWETSLTRRSFIALVTYIFASIYMIIVGLPNPFVGAFVPVLGYILSTLSIPYVRKLWMSRIRNKSVSKSH